MIKYLLTLATTIISITSCDSDIQNHCGSDPFPSILSINNYSLESLHIEANEFTLQIPKMGYSQDTIQALQLYQLIIDPDTITFNSILNNRTTISIYSIDSIPSDFHIQYFSDSTHAYTIYHENMMCL